MESHNATTDHPKKRRRRRRIDRPPLTAWLAPRSELKGNIGVISHDLFTHLFGFEPGSELATSKTHFIAVTPRSLLSQNSVEDAAWTLLPVRAKNEGEEDGSKLDTSSIILPTDSLALQGLTKALEDKALIKKQTKGKSGAEVHVLDVEPVPLDEIYVTVDGDAFIKHEEVQQKFGGGFAYSRANGVGNKGKGKAKKSSNEVNRKDDKLQAQEQDTRLTSAVREALASSIVVRQNDLLPLPLPAHPITHVPLPPAKITLCEPVSQGILTDTTKVIINRAPLKDPLSRILTHQAARKALNRYPRDNDYDTSNEQFFSAAENEEPKGVPLSDLSNSLSSSDGSERDSDDSSDDSLQNMIKMQAPQLPFNMSSTATTTPRAGGSRLNGTSTPGSVFSNFSTATARPSGKPKSHVFRARGLMSKLPDELLHPKPAADEDEEARVFVDTKSLMKIGCFSGDWVQIEAVSPSPSNPLGLDFTTLSLKLLRTGFRPAKVYGLSDLSQTSKPIRRRECNNGRRSSVVTASSNNSTSLAAWLSPILLANLGQPHSIKLCPLTLQTREEGPPRDRSRESKADASSCPLVAQEMTLLRVSTPLSTERALQPGIFSALKRHFELKRRILKDGDLIAFPIDVSVSRLVAQSAVVSDGEQEVEEILSIGSEKTFSTLSNLDVAWFRVEKINTLEVENNPQVLPADIWGRAACIEPTFTRMRQAGSEACKIPPSLHNPWQHYLGTKPAVRTSLAKDRIRQYTSSKPESFITPLRRRLRELLAASTSPRALHLGLDPIAVLIHSTQRSIGKATLASCAAIDLGLHMFEIDAYDILAESGSAGDVKTEALLKARMERAVSCGPSCTVILLRHVDALTADRTVTALKELVSEARVIIATTTDIENVSEGIRGLFTHELEVTAPDEGEREGILKCIVQDRAIHLANDVDLSSIAIKSAALVAGDLVDIVERAIAARQDRLEHLLSISSTNDQSSAQALMRDILVAGGEKARCVTKTDFDHAVEAARKNFADAIGAPKIPNVSWEDVGGLENVKDAVMETIQLPLERPELFAKGMKKRSGILFYGPPGTGKTLLAKAIATEFSLNFFSVKGPELLNMYIGESEANVRRVFQRARDARPCVVFFDELDSVAPKRGNQGDSGGVMDRIVSQLLAELDGMSDGEEGGGGVFIIGATNRPDLLDQALLRPGRFDKMLYLGVSDTHAKQLTIMEALTRKFTMHPATSLHRVAESLPFTYTGADLYALCSDAMLKAITRQASAVDAKINAMPEGSVTTAYFFDHLATDEDIAVLVQEEDFFAAQRELVGSVRSVVSLQSLFLRYAESVSLQCQRIGALPPRPPNLRRSIESFSHLQPRP